METFVGDTVKLTIDCHLDISGYLTKLIKYKKPDGTTGCWTSAICPADNTCMTYTTLVTDLDVAGLWFIQAYVEGGGAYLHGKWDEFTVFTPYPDCT